MQGRRADSAVGRAGAKHRSAVPERRARALARLCSLCLCVNAAACTQPAERTKVRVRIEAEAAVKELVDDVEVLVETQASKSAGWQTSKSQRFAPKATHNWPLEFTVDNGDPSLIYQVTATARDAQTSVVAHARAIRDGDKATKRTILLVFETACLRRMKLCPNGETCHASECVDAHYEASFDPTTESADAAPPAEDAGPDPGGPTLAVEGEPCAPDGARACLGESSRTPLSCEGGSWKSATICEDDELCDTTAGAQRGKCRRIAAECRGHDPNVPFCDRDMMLVCENMFGFRVRPCGDNYHCVAKTKAMCECMTGFVKHATGGCERTLDCSVENGGCDPLTKCSLSGMERVCTACPGGYVGTGEVGCEPLLGGLTTSAGALEPAFDPEVHSYRVKLPLLAQQLTLTPSAPSAARIELNGSVVTPGQDWTTPTLPLAELPVKLTLTSSSGETSEYEVIVDRGGKQTAYLKATNVDEGDNFGISVAMSGDTLVVGAMYEDSAAMSVNGDQSDNNMRDSGAAYVFVQRGDVWEQQAYLKPNDPAVQDYFGVALAIDGDTLVIGSVHVDITGLSGTFTRPGAAYVFTRSDGKWSQSARLTGATAADAFGYAVSISGNTIAVGSPSDGGDGTTYVYTRNGPQWNEQKLKAQPKADRAMFGCAVALSKDTLLVGANTDSTELTNAGSAYVYVRSGGRWTLQQRLTSDPPASGANFGYAVALAGDDAVIAAPRAAAIAAPVVTSPGQVFAFRRSEGAWQQTQVLSAMLPRSSDAFGSSLALNDTALLIGASGDSSGARGVGADASRRDLLYSGAGYLYARENRQWEQSAYLKAGNAGLNDSFGLAATLAGDTAVFSANWEQSKSAGINGNPNDDSANTSGAVYVFK